MDSILVCYGERTDRRFLGPIPMLPRLPGSPDDVCHDFVDAVSHLRGKVPQQVRADVVQSSSRPRPARRAAADYAVLGVFFSPQGPRVHDCHVHLLLKKEGSKDHQPVSTVRKAVVDFSSAVCRRPVTPFHQATRQNLWPSELPRSVALRCPCPPTRGK